MGCAVEKKAKKFVKECVLPEDQSGTLTGRWPVLPVEVSLQTGSWGSAEQTLLTTAADSWNTFYESVHDFTLLKYDTEGAINQSSASVPDPLCTSSILQNDQFTGTVVIYKLGAWPHDQGIIALTTICPVADTPLPRFYMAIMEVNYQNFFISGKKIPDLQSIVLHELGHLIGLDHSCEAFQKTGMPDCRADGLDADYVNASMFPIFFFPNNVNGEIKRELKDNDQGRANCIYADILGETGGTGTSRTSP